MKAQTLAEQLFYTTVRIETVTADGQASSGTGFLFNYRAADRHFPFIVSNKHVVMGMTGGCLYFHRGNVGEPLVGSAFQLNIEGWPQLWTGHPSPDVDIAIAPFQQMIEHAQKQYGVELFFRCIDTTMVPTQSQLEELDALESVTFFGYPNGIWDTKNFLPIARRGMTATPPSVDFEDSPRFIIDASVFGGSSGSPVFLLNQGMYSDRHGNTTLGSRVWFLGVVAAVYFRTSLNKIIAVPVPTQQVPMAQQQEMLDLGIVFKARTVIEVIESFLKAGKHIA